MKIQKMKKRVESKTRNTNDKEMEEKRTGQEQE